MIKKTRARRRWHKLLRAIGHLLILAIAIVTTSAFTSVPGGGSRTHQTGIELVAHAQATVTPAEGDLLQAWSDALLIAELDDGLGYPWADTATGTLVVTVTSTAAEQLANRWIAGGVAHPNPKVGHIARPLVPVRLRTASLSYAALEGIKNDATRLVQAGLPDAEAIYQAAPDWEHNRVVLTMSRQSDALINALAARYGTTAVAVRVEPRPFTMPHQGTRSQDRSYFWGGAIINTGTHGCSSGFSWTDGTTGYMLTAAHCAASGASTVNTTDASGNVVEKMGSITSGTRENWTNGVGTVSFPGDNIYRGDVALVQVDAGKNVGAAMYSGAYPDQTTATIVRSMWTTTPQAGQQYCTSGSNTYAMCGWSVDSVRTNYQYSTGEWGYNVTIGKKTSGTSTNLGDSGGPVYTVNGDGTIQAKGIHSGGTAGPSTCGSFWWQNCVEVFTDIVLPFQYFPGWLKTA